MRHATTDNFLHAAVYPCARCLLRKDAATALASAQQALEATGLRLKVCDCYRPAAVHQRGGAVDITLVDVSGKELEMPTAHDDFTAKAHADAPASPEAAKNRAMLRAAMEAAGFKGIRTEWWHFEAAGSRQWAIEVADACEESRAP